MRKKKVGRDGGRRQRETYEGELYNLKPEWRSASNGSPNWVVQENRRQGYH